jgi:hypothetical protein
VDRTDDGLPWEATLAGFCMFAVIFGAIYAEKTEIALGVVSIIAIIIPTYFVHNYEVPCNNWELGSMFSLKTTKAEVRPILFIVIADHHQRCLILCPAC